MEFRQFEREFLRLAFTTDVELSAPALAFVTSIPIAEAKGHLDELVTQGTLELSCDDDGHLSYSMPDRPSSPLALDHPALIGHRDVRTHLALETIAPGQPPRALVVRQLAPLRWQGSARATPRQAVAAMMLNAFVCPGVGSMVGGRTGTGLAQLTLFGVGLPLAVFTVGIPLMMFAWIWAVTTGAQLVAEARE